MTAVIAFNFKEVVVLLSDIRLTYDPKGHRHEDEMVKVTRLADNALIGFAGPLNGALKVVKYIAQRRAEIVRSKKEPMITLRHLSRWFSYVSQKQLTLSERKHLQCLIVGSHLKHNDNTRGRYSMTKWFFNKERGSIDYSNCSNEKYCVIGSGEETDVLEPFLDKAYDIHYKEKDAVMMATDISIKYSLISSQEHGISSFFQLFVVTPFGYRHIPYSMIDMTRRSVYSSSFLPPNPWGDDPAPTLADVCFTKISRIGKEGYFVCTETKGEYTLSNPITGQRKKLRVLTKDDPATKLGIRLI